MIKGEGKEWDKKRRKYYLFFLLCQSGFYNYI